MTTIVEVTDNLRLHVFDEFFHIERLIPPKDHPTEYLTPNELYSLGDAIAEIRQRKESPNA